ncbi:MAG: asparagine synthase C-terminal domain-containing protein, partial [Ruminococcus sp.]|nr:asparagine synthase C-terminal domain-containing protein [Ruminococcus sp.]
ERKKILKISTLAKSPTEITEPYFDKMEDKDDVTKMQYLDLNLWLTGDILLKADKMSMANSLELRVPFLDREVMKTACHIPLKYRITRHEKTDKHTPYITKYALRLAAGRELPKPTAGKKKLGFPVPIRVWLREEKYYNIVKKEFLSADSVKFFDIEEILNILNEHKNGKKDNSRKIWTIYTFLIWYNEYFKD